MLNCVGLFSCKYVMYCNEPFIHSEISPNGDVRLCCDSWHPKVVGNIFDNTLEEIWVNEEAFKVRQTINEQTYDYCKLDVCPKYKQNKLKSTPQKVTTVLPKVLKFSFDDSCNLNCPSCRIEKIQYKKNSKEYKNSAYILESIKKSYYSLGTDQETYFVITGSGDPFGGDVFRNFLYNLDGNKIPKIKIFFLTNGVMMTPKVLNKITKIHKNIYGINIGVDAFHKKTYETLRQGGNFDILLNNIDNLHRCKSLDHVKVSYTFVVQNQNFKEVIKFANWILSIPKATVRFTKLLPWTNMNIKFADEDVLNTNHKNYQEAIKLLTKLKSYNSDRIDFTNII